MSLPFRLTGSLLIALVLSLSSPASGQDASTFITQAVPTTMAPGEVATVSVTMRNSGTSIWTAAGAYKLGTQNPQDNTLWAGFTRVYLNAGDSIAPGQDKTFSFSIIAPATPGTYNFQWRMVKEGVAWFGAFSTNVAIQVQAAVADNSQFVSQAVPTALTVGETRSVSVVMKNTGTASWTTASGFKLGTQNPQDNTLWTGSTRVYLTGAESIAPGQQKTFTFNITAPSTAGTYPFQWRMVHDGLAWFGAFSTNVQIVVSQPSSVTLCPGVTAPLTPGSDAGPAFRQCIANTPSGGVLSVPINTYEIGSQIVINKPITLRTTGTQGSTQGCESISCAVLKASPSYFAIGGLIDVQNTHDVVLDHLVIDGNRGARLGSAAAAQCAGNPGNTRYGFNLRFGGCTFCKFLYSVTKNTLCGSALEWVGADSTIVGSVFRNNGQNAVHQMWADGLTLLNSDRATVTDNTFVDNSDVALIFGGGINALIANNTVSQPGQVTFAGLMLDNFNNTAPGNFTGTMVSGNTISCGAGSAKNCQFGIELGPHPWYASSNIVGGTVTGNTVTNARQGINVDGAGVAGSPLVIYGNTVTGSPSSASFQCNPGVSRATSNLNIYAVHSVVDRRGDTTPATNRSFDYTVVCAP